MKYDFNVPILDLDDKPLQENGTDLVLGKVLAKAMYMQHAFKDPLKLMESWARPMYKGNAIELDSSDLGLFKELIINAELGLFPAVREAALNVLNHTNGKEKMKK